MNKELQIKLQMFVDDFTSKNGVPPTIDQINQHIQGVVQEINFAPRSDFEGYSSEQMHNLLDLLWSSNSIIKLNELSDEEFAQIPLFRQIETFTSILSEKGSMKMTVTGSLPMAVVREVYSVGTPDWYIDKYQTKRLLESDSKSVQRTHIMLKVMKIIKVQKGIITLTKRGVKLIQDKHQLLSELLYSFCYQFNWPYFDRYENESIGRLGCGFSLAMVAKYGDDWHSSEFYAEKYFKALPMCAEDVMPGLTPKGIPGESCYTIRTFTRFMLEFGIIEMKEERIKNEDSIIGAFDIKYNIKKSPLFDKMLTV